jgi:hypothetical protein
MSRLIATAGKRSRTWRRRVAFRGIAGGTGLFAFAGLAVAAIVMGPQVAFAPIVIPLAMLAAALAVICVAFVITIPIAFGLW